mgnify:CR=1 FL=1
MEPALFQGMTFSLPISLEINEQIEITRWEFLMRLRYINKDVIIESLVKTTVTGLIFKKNFNFWKNSFQKTDSTRRWSDLNKFGITNYYQFWAVA